MENNPKEITSLQNKILSFPLTEHDSSYNRDEYGGGSGNGGDGTMNQFVTKDELKNSLEIQELKLSEKISSTSHEMEKSFLKVDKSFLDLRLELEKQHKSNVRWIIGTAIAVAGVIVGALALFIK